MEGSSGITICAAYVPARRVKNPHEQQIHFIFACRDEQVSDTLRELRELDGDSTDQKKLEDYVTKHLDRLWVERDVEGIVQNGMRSDSYRNSEEARVQKHLDSDFVVL